MRVIIGAGFIIIAVLIVVVAVVWHFLNKE